MKGTTNGTLNIIESCYLKIPRLFTMDIKNAGLPTELMIKFNNVPDVSDSKSAVYNNDAVIGRSFPLYSFSHSSDRQISMQMHFFVVEPEDVEKNLNYLNWIRSAVYPASSVNLPFQPPPICKLKCGMLLDKDELSVILQNYSVRFPTDVVWDEDTFVPFKFDVDTSWLVVYTSSQLPYQNDIITSSRIIKSRR